MFLDFNIMFLVDSIEILGCYNGVCVLFSGRFLVVVDNNFFKVFLYIIDMEIWDIVEIFYNGDLLEVMWLNGMDELVVIVFY